MKLRMVLFMFLLLLAKEWEKILLDEEQDIFHSRHLDLGV